MKSKILKISIILGLSILFIFIFYLLNKDESKLSLNQNRVFKDTLKLEKSISLDKKLSLMKFKNNHLYFLSWTDNNQGKLFSLDLVDNNFDPEIDLTDNLESFIINNYFIENGKISYIIKADKSLRSYDLQSKLKSAAFYKKNFARVSKRNSKMLVSGWDNNYKIFFEKYDLQTKEVVKLDIDDDYLSEYNNTGIALDGVYYDNERNSVMLPYSINRAYVFDNKYNYRGKVDLIFNKIAFNFRYSQDKKELMVDPNNLNPNLSGYLSQNDIFYVLTDQSTKWNNMNQCYIDSYEVNKNEYLSSFKIDDYNNSKPRSIVINGDKVYVLFEENLNIYSIHEK
ncbi:hypothetical protein [Flavobacterium sp. HTF]|uniref:hypothetical protein n=1 Tax=Flavobacterium sp. HTF TaxID=2170732 RepID=UPI000F4E69EF|nr:hypothetical protein [Flavobacterium sp. HTF]